MDVTSQDGSVVTAMMKRWNRGKKNFNVAKDDDAILLMRLLKDVTGATVMMRIKIALWRLKSPEDDEKATLRQRKSQLR